MNQQQQLLTQDDREDIESFLYDMRQLVDELPTYEGTDQPRDNDGVGSYMERDLFSGVTLVMDWGYLDATSTYLVVDHDAPGYERRNANGNVPTFINDCGSLYDRLANELRDVLNCGRIQYDEYNSMDSDVWHIHVTEPY